MCVCVRVCVQEMSSSFLMLTVLSFLVITDTIFLKFFLARTKSWWSYVSPYKFYWNVLMCEVPVSKKPWIWFQTGRRKGRGIYSPNTHPITIHTICDVQGFESHVLLTLIASWLMKRIISSYLISVYQSTYLSKSLHCFSLSFVFFILTSAIEKLDFHVSISETDITKSPAC